MLLILILKFNNQKECIMENEPLIVLGSIILALALVLFVWYAVSKKIKKKSEHESLNKKIALHAEFSETVRLGSAISVSVTTKQLLFCNSDTLHLGSDIKYINPSVGVAYKSERVDYAITIYMNDGSSKGVRVIGLEMFLKNMFMLASISGEDRIFSSFKEA